MIELLIPVGKFKDKSSAKWDETARQVKYTIVHWLAFWNDIESLHYILENVEESVETYTKVMSVSHRDLTPIDIAGTRGCHEAVLLLVDFFVGKIQLLKKIFRVTRTRAAAVSDANARSVAPVEA